MGPARILAVAVVLGIGALAHADDAEVAGILARLEFHGFVSQGFLITTENDYLAHSEGHGSLEFTEVGFNVTASLTDRLRAGIQLFARDLGPIGDYRATLDWFYLDYKLKDWLGLRAGRVKLPFGLYNDTSDVDAARTAVLLPAGVYPPENRDFLLALTGAELYGYLRLGDDGGALDYRALVGTIFLDLEPDPQSPLTLLDLSIPYVVGGRLMWETPLEGLRVGGSVYALRLDTEILFPMNPMPVEVNIPVVLWVVSAELARGDLLVAAEYSRWHSHSESSDPMTFPDTSQVSERAYAMATYRLRSWLQGGFYYSLLFPDTADREGREAQQHDVAVTARFDINPYWLIKLEAHYLHGTAALSTSLNERPLNELQPDWGLFLVKTTAYF